MLSDTLEKCGANVAKHQCKIRRVERSTDIDLLFNDVQLYSKDKRVSTRSTTGTDNNLQSFRNSQKEKPEITFVTLATKCGIFFWKNGSTHRLLFVGKILGHAKQAYPHITPLPSK